MGWLNNPFGRPNGRVEAETQHRQATPTAGVARKPALKVGLDLRRLRLTDQGFVK
jgi:hypothetical protein